MNQIVQILYFNDDQTAKKYCFSDTIFKVNEKQEEVKRKILVTSKFMYEIGNKTQELKRKINIREIEKIKISIKSGTLCQFILQKEGDFMINSFKRTQLIQFICKVVQEKYRKKIQVVQSEDLITKFQGKEFMSKINPQDNNINIQEGYLNGRKYGFFFMKVPQLMNIFGNNEGYKEFFFVLCDIGLICLRNPKEDVPKLIIPIIGSSVNVNINPMNTNKDNSFMIVSENDKQYQFYCQSQDELNEWTKEIFLLQEQGIQKVQMTNRDLIK